MLANIVKGKRVIVTEWRRQFDWEGETNWGFAFPCTEEGVLLPDTTPLCYENYEACLRGEVDGRKIVDRGVTKFEHSYWQPGHGICVCEATVVLDGDTRGEGIDCPGCNRIYNSVGQQLAPRSQWEESVDAD